MAQYLVLIYDVESELDGGGEELSMRVYKEHMAFGERNGSAIRGGEALQRTSDARSVRRKKDGFAVTDGPFVETKEALCGYYLLEAESIDAAVELAKEVPAPFGGVEVRPIRVFE